MSIKNQEPVKARGVQKVSADLHILLLTDTSETHLEEKAVGY